MALGMVLGLSGCCAGRCDTWSRATREDNAYFRVDGRRDRCIAYRRYGEPGREPTLVFIHGLAQTKFAWRDVGRALAADHQVLLVDLLGHGDSSKPLSRRGRDYYMAEQGRAVAALLDHERQAGRIGRVVLIGLSYGGGVALETARHYFEESAGGAANPVAGLVVMAPGCYHWPYFDSSQFAEERLFLKGSLLVPPAAALAHDQVFEMSILERSFWRQHRISEEARREVREQYRSVRARLAVAQATLDMAEELAARRGQRRFGGIACPTLALQGEFDAYVDRCVMDELAADMAANEGFEFVVVPDAGHDLPGEKATEMIAAIREFLTRYCSSS
jgi:pimeloyl-ACP methyl ester carboxylesterase